ncbi:sensory box histidine kinase [Filimonas lacunae]|nr:sensory box histidine kinase [Filimonas lacunae]
MKENADYKKADSFLYVNNDSAFYYYNNVVVNGKDSVLVAMAYNNMSVLQSSVGDYWGSQESLLTSLTYLNENKERDHSCLAADYNELGSVSLELKHFDDAIKYYDLAIRFAKDSGYQRVVLNNKAVVYQKKKNFNQAISLYLSILNKSKTDTKEYARVISNLAKTRWLQNPDYDAAPELLAALQMRQKEGDLWGQNASYAHLSDYYKNSHPDSAFIYADKMYSITRQINNPNDELEALQKLIMLGSPQMAKQYFSRYQFLSDSLQNAWNTAKNQFALIRYEVGKNKMENLKLQQENTERKLQVAHQRLLLIVILVFIVSAVVITITWYKKRKQKMLWETQTAIRENRLQTSQKVHDVVANGLYLIMMEMEHKQGIDKEHLLDRIEGLYEQSRDISYEQPEQLHQNFYEELAGLITSFATPATKIMIVGNNSGLWTGVDSTAKHEVKHILQEWMVNMNKHSQAQNVVVKFERQDNYIIITYKDDGIGFRRDFTYGNGFTNTENRIRSIGGRFIFEQPDKGVKIHVSFPIT